MLKYILVFVLSATSVFADAESQIRAKFEKFWFFGLTYTEANERLSKRGKSLGPLTQSNYPRMQRAKGELFTRENQEIYLFADGVIVGRVLKAIRYGSNECFKATKLFYEGLEKDFSDVRQYGIRNAPTTEWLDENKTYGNFKFSYKFPNIGDKTMLALYKGKNCEVSETMWYNEHPITHYVPD